MLDPSIANLLSTLVGGSLAVIGSFTANYAMGKFSQKNEKMIFFRSKIEELYMILEEMERIDKRRVKRLKFVKTSEEIDSLIADLNKCHDPQLENIREDIILQMEDVYKVLGEDRDDTGRYMELFNRLGMIITLYLHAIQERFIIFNKDTANIHRDVENGRYDVEYYEANRELISKIYSEMYLFLAKFCEKRGISI